MDILIAEDDRISRILLEKLLAQAGHRVVTTTNGAEAIEAFKENDVEMALLDWMMPKTDGIEVCKAIRELEAGTGQRAYVIMVTAKNQSEDIVMALEAGADDFVSKPYDSKVLESRITAGSRLMEKQPESLPADWTPDPVASLSQEHVTLLRVMGVMELVTNALNDNSGVRARIPADIIEWCKAVLLPFWTTHHTKEDEYINIFREQVTAVHGESASIFSRSSLGQILREHKTISNLLQDVHGTLAMYDPAGDFQSLVGSVSAFLVLARSHISREDNFFFPLSKKYMTEKNLEEMIEKFQMIDLAAPDGMGDELGRLDEIEKMLNLGGY